MALKGKDPFQVFAFIAIIEETVITDLLETGWEYMHQVPPYELSALQCDYSLRFAVFFSPGGKCHLMFIYGKNTAVGYGNLMCVSAKVLDGIAKAVESLFDVWTPVFFIEEIPELRPFVRIFQFFTGSRKNQLVLQKE